MDPARQRPPKPRPPTSPRPECPAAGRKSRPGRRRRWCGAALAVCLLLAASAVARAEPPAGHRYALLIGTSAYEQWPNLVNPVPDVRALADLLRRRYGFLPEVLENPDRETILGKLRRYAALDYGPDDQLVIVFAGHGTLDEVTGIGYLAAADSASRRRDPTFESLLDYPRLLTLVDRLPCRQVLLVVDACFSGNLEVDRGAVSASRGGGDARVRRFVTSGGKEYVPDGDPDRHSPFMRQLLAGLAAPGAGQAVSLRELGESSMAGLQPRPRWGSFGSGAGGEDFVFRVGETDPPPAPQGLVAERGGSASAPPAPEPAPSRLRAEPAALSSAELQRLLRHRELFDVTWSPEGDFPNQLRTQTFGLWDVVLDLESGLMWQQAGSDHRMSRADAQAYVAQLNADRHAGFANWRLPTAEELASLLEPSRLNQGLYVSPLFSVEQETCWTADRDRRSGEAYFVSFLAGRLVLAYGGKQAFVRAVRTP